MTDKDYVCEDYGDQKDWVQVRVSAPLAQLEVLSSVMSMINENLMIEDYSDIDLKTCYGDLIDESILNADKTVAAVSVFLPADVGISDALAFLRERMEADGIDGKVTLQGVNEEDWANNWKQYYKPIHIGQKLVIVPAWESYTPAAGEITVRMDPGMAFGTGTHETTRLVIGLLEDYTHPGDYILDVGTGSGILAICASKLGAARCRAYDIDPVAVRVARENIAADGITNVTCDQSDLLRDVDLSEGKFDLVCANIVADIIIRMAPDIRRYMKAGAVILCSGIIESRAADVIDALTAKGLELIEQREENDWCALAFRNPEEV